LRYRLTDIRGGRLCGGIREIAEKKVANQNLAEHIYLYEVG